jgi:DNA-binding NarL/FixJ family response regulator
MKTTLTPRELEVMRVLLRGLQNKHIAEELGISLGTVKVHLINISRKLGVRNRTQLALLADKL